MTTQANLQIREYAALLSRWLWVIVLGAAVAGGAVYYARRGQVPVYEAATTLLIKEGQGLSGPVYGNMSMSASLGATYSQLLVSKPILEEAALRVGAASWGSVSVAQVGGTPLIRLSVSHTDPALAALLANTIPSVFIEGYNQAQSERLAGSKESLEREMNQVEAELNATQVSLAEESAKAEPDPAEMARLENLLAQRRSTYAGLLQTYESIRAAEMWGRDTLSVVEAAEVPQQPVSPNTSRDAAMGAMVGAMLAGGVALLIEYLDDRVRRPGDIERAVRLSTLATIERLPKDRMAANASLMASQTRSAFAEAHRVLRTNIEYAVRGVEHKAVALLVTSTQPLEGKTTLVANLGASLAQAGRRVLLVDADLRRPTLHEQFELENGAGLASFFMERQSDLSRWIRQTDIEGLRVLTAGPVPPNPGEVLSFAEADALMERLRGTADYVIFDSPPVLYAADAGILAQKVDGVVLVAEVGKTSAARLQQAVGMLQTVQARLLGVVLNKHPRRASNYDYYYEEGRREQGRQHGLATAAQALAALNRAQGKQVMGRDRSGGAARPRDRRRAKNRRIWARWPWHPDVTAGMLAMAMLILAGVVVTLGLTPGNVLSPWMGGGATTAGSQQPFASETPAVKAKGLLLPPTATVRPTATATVTPTATSAAPAAMPTAGETATPSAAAVGPHGMSAALGLSEDRTVYEVGEQVFFVIDVRNHRDVAVIIGVVELRVSGEGAFATPWTDRTVEPGGVFHAEYYIVFRSPGQRTVTEAICFAPLGACELGGEGEDWEVVSPSVSVTIT